MVFEGGSAKRLPQLLHARGRRPARTPQQTSTLPLPPTPPAEAPPPRPSPPPAANAGSPPGATDHPRRHPQPQPAAPPEALHRQPADAATNPAPWCLYPRRQRIGAEPATSCASADAANPISAGHLTTRRRLTPAGGRAAPFTAASAAGASSQAGTEARAATPLGAAPSVTAVRRHRGPPNVTFSERLPHRR